MNTQYSEYSDAKKDTLQRIKSIPNMNTEMLTAVEENLPVFIEERRTGGSSTRPSSNTWGLALLITSEIPFGGDRYFAVRNDNVDLFAQLLPMVAGFAAIPFFGGAATAVIGAVVSIIVLTNSVRKHGVQISHDEYHVLLALKGTGPATVAELATALGGLSISPDAAWDVQRVQAILDKLNKIRDRSNSVTALVEQGFDGKWSTAA